MDTTLRDAIRNSGLTHYRIGQMAGVSPTVIDRFISGARPDLRLSTAAKIADALGLELTHRRKPLSRQGKKS